LDVAKAGLAFLIENRATDHNAPARKSRRERELEAAIFAYVEALPER
jgi:hypothetical protein